MKGQLQGCGPEENEQTQRTTGKQGREGWRVGKKSMRAAAASHLPVNLVLEALGVRWGVQEGQLQQESWGGMCEAQHPWQVSPSPTGHRGAGGMKSA